MDEQAPQKSTKAEDEIAAALEASEIQKKRKSDRKKLIKNAGIGTGLLFLAYIIYLLFVPYKSTMAFGICKVFLERQIPYPDTLHLSTVEEFDTSVRIWYAHTDPFGEYRLEPIRCYFRPDPQMGSAIDKVTIARREVDPAIVEAFNKTIPAILAYPPDLTIPTPLTDSLRDLQLDFSRFRRPIL